MTTFTIYYRDDFKKEWVNGVLTNKEPFKRIICAKADNGIYISDQNMINGKVTNNADDYVTLINNWYSKKMELNIVFEKR